MTARVHVDANVLVYGEDARDPRKMALAQNWITALFDSGRGAISIQVLNEFYSVATRRLKPGLAPEKARRVASEFFAWSPAETNEATMAFAWGLEQGSKYSFWDCLILAAALEQECTHFLTEDLQHGQVIHGMRIIDPFQISPQAVLSQ
jgi:predicted nucleic acid-binding protein